MKIDDLGGEKTFTSDGGVGKNRLQHELFLSLPNFLVAEVILQPPNMLPKYRFISAKHDVHRILYLLIHDRDPVKSPVRMKDTFHFKFGVQD